jgi:lipopolysaccharide biosynthesis protein
LLCNDSVYGPFAPLGPLLARAEPSEADVWGMTEGRNHGPHLQSYFLLLHRRAIAHPAFAAFWRDLPYLNDKFAVVEAGELGLSRALAAAGLRLRALFPYTQAEACFRAAARSDRPGERAMLRALDRGRALNPTHHFWRALIADLGLPLIKRELLALNPAGLDDIDDWQQIVEARFGAEPHAAAEHLAALAQCPPSSQGRGLMRLLRTSMSAP